jgi:uracil-DNA glycosylase
MFRWFESIGIDEGHFRERVYMAAVCRCFPGKNPKGGDRVPSSQEISNCSGWLDREITLLEPQLIVPMGKLAISQFMETKKLVDVIGTMHTGHRNNISTDIIPLPHPSGASTWHRREPGITLLHKALQLIRNHPAWSIIQKR